MWPSTAKGRSKTIHRSLDGLAALQSISHCLCSFSFSSSSSSSSSSRSVAALDNVGCTMTWRGAGSLSVAECFDVDALRERVLASTGPQDYYNMQMSRLQIFS